ncbi:IclR family transcriptional regulator [Actinomadura sp. 7K507]|uniref:IclR family transcriptional regulator n=1 Tax=Actinomadura sp. 7K507 TaxID=2530365 RepID=UPI0010437ACF|nr:IclR family transcriptional regulator [Actinomadura sp. 7K507]TDC94565.1 IclR family transcriptional regulator [Actinomadura sp. 7K507]
MKAERPQKATSARPRSAASETPTGAVEAAPQGPSVASRVIALLDLVGRRENGVGPREAERITGIDRSAASRLFRQLESLGWVQHGEERGTYTVGPEFFAVAAAVRQRDSLWRAAKPLLESLTEQFDETTYLAVRQDHQVVFRDKVDCAQRIRYILELNEPFPLTTGASGRAILSALPNSEVDEILAAGLTAYTPDSITEADHYRAQLAHDRELGYAYSKSGWVARGGGVASPFFDAGGRCHGAITLSAPIDRLGADRAAVIGPAVRAAAETLSRRLGYTADEDADTAVP